MIKEELITHKTAILAKEKGFECQQSDYHWNYLDKYCQAMQYHKDTCVLIPTQSLLQKWLREKHGIEVTPMPMFIDKCGYDSFKRDGYTYEVMQIYPCQHLTWSDFNVTAEDRDAEIKEEGKLECLKPSAETFELALEAGLYEALKLIKI